MTAVVEQHEAPTTLREKAPRTLGFFDQMGMWGNLGISLLGFTGAITVWQPTEDPKRALSLGAALLATVVGTLIGTAAVALAGVPGARTGQPAMVLLRGLFGTRLSWLPSVLNIFQLIGWGVFELVTIAAAMHQMWPSVPTALVVIIAGVVSTLLALYPLRWIKVLRRYVTILVVITLAYLGIRLGTHLPSVPGGGWDGFSIAVDYTIAVSVSWVPVVADYARHSRSPRAGFWGTFIGYAVTQIACYTVGLLALVTMGGDTGKVFAAFLAVPLGTVCFFVLTARETDQSFVNVYSTTVSAQNLRPGWDRRPMAVVIGLVVTLLALAVNIDNYASFLSLIGSVFVPLTAVLLVDYFIFGGKQRWDLGEDAPSRPWMLLPWLVGIAAYQLVYPGEVAGWATFWTNAAGWLHIPQNQWMSASVISFVIAGLVTMLVEVVGGRRVEPAGEVRPEAAGEPVEAGRPS
ncbi:allantoin permease [Calidifontibacter sp. DB0510]|uniref:Allantoin permease n=1 Tax=Metallococcus carri TaxID=1656884 RepID=A0A967B3L5_9MICO|nr:cytosine permease [Metallococcus carri]NHN57354.1 allantoin permease [Metallococcus carri]NOP39132.1 allantoin permease [Calidifontibacter sp. DB2511S]